MEGKTAILLEMSQWNSNDLVEQIETLGHLERSRGTHFTHLYLHGIGGYAVSREARSVEERRLRNGVRALSHLLLRD